MSIETTKPIAPVMVSIQDVHKQFGKLEVLKGVTMDIHSGDVVCVIGPSGSGKTTLLRCINFLETYQSGSILVDGQLVGYRERNGKRSLAPESEVAKIRANTAMVFQQFNLFPHMTALRNITFGPMKVHKKSK
ncbi:MAG: ATP-binding cassette domain-containing protein, partial [Thermomicrobiales bacterium]